MKKKILFAPVFAFGLFLALSSVVMAMTQEERDAQRAEIQAVRDERDQIREELKETRKELVEERNEFRDKVRNEMKEKICERWQNRIRTRLNRYENKKQQHKQIFESLLERLDKMSAKLDDAGLDTSDLEEYISVLEGKVSDLMQVHDDFLGELNLADDQTCGESEGEFKKQLGEARNMIPEVRSALDDVRDYYRDTVRPELIDLKLQLIDEDEDQDKDEDEDNDETSIKVEDSGNKEGKVIKTEDVSSTSIKVIKENIQESNSSSTTSN
jgi:hypothetical protein